MCKLHGKQFFQNLKNGLYSHTDSDDDPPPQTSFDTLKTEDPTSKGNNIYTLCSVKTSFSYGREEKGQIIMSGDTSYMKETWVSSYHENDTKTKYGGRDMLGYGQQSPQFKWPKGAKVAINFVINYEEGGERCLLHGDDKSEKLLSEIVGAEAYSTLR